jgi:lipopolysaccharide transport system ATP-binding protein
VCEAYLESEFPPAEAAQRTRAAPRAAAKPALRDQRDAFINASNLRNDLRVFRFDPHARGIGAGGASIVDAALCEADGAPLGWVVGGETVYLRIRVRCHRALASPVIGFMVKDRVAQPLFGDNTWLACADAPVPAQPGDALVAEFEFEMPRLPPGDYAVIAAVADGDQDRNVQHHWIHDALRFRSEGDCVSGGMVGLPMRAIRLERVAAIEPGRERVAATAPQ